MGLDDPRKGDASPEDDLPDGKWADDDQWPEEALTGNERAGRATAWPGGAGLRDGGWGRWPGGEGRRKADGGRRSGGRAPLRAAAIVAVVAATAGVVAAFFIVRGSHATTGATRPPDAQASAAPAPGASGGATRAAGAPGAGSGNLPMNLGGKVLAVSGTSITIGLSNGQSGITAAVTRSTKVTGKVTSISSIRVGDDVSAQVTRTGNDLTVTAIQDPSGLP